MKTIIIVDDSKTFHKLLERILSPHFNIIGKGYSGLDGLELYKKLKPDLVFMDITMPYCSGKECLKNIMTLDPKAQIIMVSSLGDQHTIAECLELGAKSYVNKDSVVQSQCENSPVLAAAFSIFASDNLEKEAA